MAQALRSRRWVLPVLGVLGVLVVAGLIGGVRLAKIAADLRRAEHQLDIAGDALEDGRLAEAQADLARAQAILTRANSRLYTSPELQILGALPVLSDNLAAIKDGVALASKIVNGGTLVLRAAEPLQSDTGKLEVPLSDGAIPLDAVAATQRQLAQLYEALPGPTEEPGGRFLVGPVRTLNDKLYAQATRRRSQVEVLSRALEVASDMAGAKGPRRYLIAVANTAEMRGSGGMILNYGELLSKDGDFSLGEFGRIEELELKAPLPASKVTLPADYLKRWDGFDVTLLWRNATMSADLPLLAPNLLEMYASARGIAANGVIQIDPQGLAAILEGIGPVDVPGLGQVSAANVVDFTLNRAYFQFPGVEERSDVLGDIAEATFKKLVNGEYGSLRPLATALQRTVVGHHLLMYATEQQTERQLRWFGVDGELPGGDGVDAFHLTSQNLSANKLDYYVDSSLKLTGERLPGRIGDVTAEITLTNTAPAGQGNPRYVFGPGGGSGQAVGQYRSAVSLYVPTGTEIVGTNGETIDTPSVDTEGGHTVIGFTVDVLAAKAATVTLQLRLAPRPASPYVMFLTPSPRVRPTTVAVDLDLGDGKRLTSTVALDRTWALVPGAKPLTIAPRQLPRLPAVG